MSVWAKNEVTAAKRRCDLTVYISDGATYAPRGTDFIALGLVYISGAATPHYALALGTMTNKRRALTWTPFTFTAAASDVVTKVAHGLETGDGAGRASNAGGALPPGLAVLTDYWVIKIDADTFYLATSLANAYAGTRVDITGAGTGTHTFTASSAQRGQDGLFTYEATQAETNHDAPETSVIVIETGSYTRANTIVNMASAADAYGDGVLENGLTRDDALRILLRDAAAKFSKVGNDYVKRDMADSKDSHSGTVTSAGRTAATIIDAT